jgi:hypothetical protein
MSIIKIHMTSKNKKKQKKNKKTHMIDIVVSFVCKRKVNIKK